MTSTTRAQVTLGVVLMISSTVFWVLMSGLVKVVGENASTNTVAFARFFIGLVTLLPWILKSPIQIFKVPALFTLILRSIFSLGVVIALFYSLRYIPIANALLLNNTFPLVVPVILKCTVRIKIPLPVWLGILLGFIGVAFVLKPTTDFFHPASIVALLSGVLAAFSIVIIRKLTQQMPVIKILFYNYLIGSAATGIYMIFYHESISKNIYFLLILIGFISSFYQFLLTRALSKASAHILSPLAFLTIPLGVILDWIGWNVKPTIFDLIGMVLVVAGGILAIIYGQGKKGELDR